VARHYGLPRRRLTETFSEGWNGRALTFTYFLRRSSIALHAGAVCWTAAASVLPIMVYSFSLYALLARLRAPPRAMRWRTATAPAAPGALTAGHVSLSCVSDAL